MKDQDAPAHGAIPDRNTAIAMPGGKKQAPEDSAKLSFRKEVAPYISSRPDSTTTRSAGSEPNFLADASYSLHSQKGNRGWAWTANFDRGKGSCLSLYHLLTFLSFTACLSFCLYHFLWAQLGSMAGFYFTERERRKFPSLVETGRYAESECKCYD